MYDQNSFRPGDPTGYAQPPLQVAPQPAQNTGIVPPQYNQYPQGGFGGMPGMYPRMGFGMQPQAPQMGQQSPMPNRPNYPNGLDLMFGAQQAPWWASAVRGGMGGGMGGGWGGLGPRFSDFAQRAQNAIGDITSMFSRLPQGPGQAPRPPQAAPAAPTAPAAQGPYFAPPPQIPQTFAGQAIAPQFFPQPQQSAPSSQPATPQAQPGNSPLAVSLFARGGRVSDLACRC